jgi:bacteriocin-like protein
MEEVLRELTETELESVVGGLMDFNFNLSNADSNQGIQALIGNNNIDSNQGNQGVSVVNF